MKNKLLAWAMALVMLTALIIPVQAEEGEALKAADTLATLEVVQGSAAGDYALNTAATRAQAAVLLVRLTGSQAAAKTDNWTAGFRDVPAWASESIMYAAHQGWVSGVDNVTFAPDSHLFAGDWFGSLLRVLGYGKEIKDLDDPDMLAFARRIGLTSRDWANELTRGQMFISAVEALTFSYREGGKTLVEGLVEKKPELRAAASALGLLDKTLTARQAADRLMPAVFCLDFYRSDEFYARKKITSSSSGFFISEDGLAVTNYHSIDGNVHGVAILQSGEEYEIERVLYYDVDIDIAVIQISHTSLKHKTASVFPYLDLAGAGESHSGDPVYTLGNPLGEGLAVSAGIISATGRKVNDYALPCIMNTADISKGSSGGALLNTRGQVIGVTSGAYAQGNNMYLAVPVDPVMTADLTVKGWTLWQVVEREYGKY